MVFRDLHNFVRPDPVAQAQTGVVNRTPISLGCRVNLGVRSRCPLLFFGSDLFCRTYGTAGLRPWSARTLLILATIPHRAIDEMYFALLHPAVLGYRLWCVWALPRRRQMS